MLYTVIIQRTNKPGNVIDHERASSAAVVGPRDCPEPFLTSGVPAKTLDESIYLYELAAETNQICSLIF